MQAYRLIVRKPKASILASINFPFPRVFKLKFFAENVPNARAMALGDKGTVFVGSRREGKVHALVDTDGDRVADEMYLLADGLKLPSGVAFRDGDLYVAEVHQVWKLPNIESQLANPPKKVMINDQFSDGYPSRLEVFRFWSRW